MRQVKKKNDKNKVTAMIMLSFCLIALTSIFTIKASIDKVNQRAGDVLVTKETQTTQKENPSDEEREISTEADDKEDVQADSEAANASVPTTDIPTVDSQDNSTQTSTYVCPMDMSIATVSKPYSMDMVIYNSTLDQYMTHPGIDVEGPTGSGVKAIADGTIIDIYEDPAYGTTIEVNHGNGIIAKYGNLESGKLVETGDTVTKGQHLANIGQTALYESLDKTHLHFELMQNEESIDPATLIHFQ